MLSMFTNISCYSEVQQEESPRPKRNENLSDAQAVRTLGNFSNQENDLPCAVPSVLPPPDKHRNPKAGMAGQQVTFYFPKTGKHRTNAHDTKNSPCDLFT